MLDFNPEGMPKNKLFRYFYCGVELLCPFLMPYFLLTVLPFDVIPKYLGFDMPLVSMTIIILIVLAIGYLVDIAIKHHNHESIWG